VVKAILKKFELPQITLAGPHVTVREAMKLEGNFSGSAMELKKCSQWIS
jgi:hypothetical protein